MDTKITGICIDCTARHKCSFRGLNDDRIKFECDHHDPDVFSPTELILHQVKSSDSKPLAGESTGICITCIHAKNCQWTNNEIVIFHCEHFE